MTTIDSPLAVILSVRSPLTDLAVLDIGCGEGGLARLLSAQGARVTGVDPGPAAVQQTTTAVPEAAFVEGVAEALPFRDGAFDLTVMVNALHHVPVALMGQALREAMRVLKRGGFFIVIEPLAEGSFFEALRLIEDETEVRNAAQAAIGKTVAAGKVKLVRTLTYNRRESFGDAGEVLERIVTVDPSRGEAVERNKAAVLERVGAVATRVEGRLVLDQPVRANIFAG